MKETMLFVDDDVNLLQGLQRMLRPKRHEWDMTFLSNPLEALEKMKSQCYDVVVADMRMPEMDGAELLARVKDICPKSVRIILSGQAELDTIMEAIGSTHQYLSKPCDAEMLQSTIDKASKLRQLVRNEKLEEYVSQLRNIPSQPDLYDAVIRELQSPAPSLEIIGRIASKDMGMSAKILQLTNSSFFGTKREVTSVHEGVGVLGSELLKRLFRDYDVFLRADGDTIHGLHLGQLHRRGISVGNFALRIATVEDVDRSEAEMCSCTGLLCRIGCIIMARFAPELYQQVIALEPESPAAVAKERELFGTTHSEVGGYLLGLWGLPNAVVEAASHHHGLAEQGSADHQPQDFSILSALQIAEQLASTTNFAAGESVENFEQLRDYRSLLARIH
ncbi:MAG: HDOD domain-containing protein [Bdellovibrionota bacterium]